MARPLLLYDLAESAHGGRSMTLSFIAPVIVFGRLAQIRPSEGGQRTPWELIALFLVGLILFVALTGLLVLRVRRALTELTHARRHRRPLVASAWGFDRGIDPDAAADDSVPHPPAR